MFLEVRVAVWSDGDWRCVGLKEDGVISRPRRGKGVWLLEQGCELGEQGGDIRVGGCGGSGGRRDPYVKEFTGTIGLDQSSELRCGDGFQVLGSITLELNDRAAMDKFHGQGVIVCQYWTKGLQPMHTEDHIGSANW